MSIHYKTDEEVELLRKSALAVSKTLSEVAKVIKIGMKTIDIDAYAEQVIRDMGGVPSFKGFGSPGNEFPFSLCISVNDAVVHGFPGQEALREGDVVSIDCGVYLNGFHGDHAYTFVMAGADVEVLKMVQVTKEATYKGIEQAIVGNRVGDIGAAIEAHTFGRFGYGVVRELVGHGLGAEMHEDPQIPNYGRRGSGKRLKENLVLAIEPMITLGERYIYTDQDGWTIRTEDGLPAAHFEHDICVKKGQAEILSDYTNIEAEEANNKDLATYEGDELIETLKAGK